MPKEKGDNVIEVRLAHEDDSEPKPTQEAANLLASFWDRIHTEFNVAKAVKSVTSDSQEYEDTFALCEDTGVRHKSMKLSCIVFSATLPPPQKRKQNAGKS